jgi:transcriptional regulator with XRE-family HTH domain
VREIMLNLSAWIERRADNLKPYADHIIHSVKAYEAEIERLRRPEAAQVRVNSLPCPDTLAQIIRRVDGSNSLGAGELAERILSALEPDLLSTTGVELGERLQRARNERGKSLRDIENITGVSYSVIARIERGECDKPTPRVYSCLESWISGLDMEPNTVAQPDGWRDIDDEAKKAGLIYVVTNDETFHTAYWSLYAGGTWFIAGTTLSIHPRKWMPLPPAPEKEG